jgi:hypothetical protein
MRNFQNLEILVFLSLRKLDGFQCGRPSYSTLTIGGGKSKALRLKKQVGARTIGRYIYKLSRF